MKGRLFLWFTLTIGLALLLIWAVAAQGTKVAADIQTASSAISTDRTESHSNNQNAASLGYTPDITFIPAFTIYLPAIFKNYVGCTTVPTLISPPNSSSLTTLIPLFQWNSGDNPDATTLRLEVARNIGFTGAKESLWYSPAQGAGEFRFPRNLDPATIYYWRAFLLCGGIEGPYSDAWSFTTGSDGTILPASTLVAPGNGSTAPTTTVTLQWSPVRGAVEYLVRWREVGQGGYTYDWVTETQVTISWLSANTTYEWWVSARNDYAIGADSETWQFTTPAGSSSVSLQDLNRSFVIEGGGTTFVLEGQDSK
jgi:hypothetical protein